MATKKALRIGFIVNPVAGLGGPAALKGSDSNRARDLLVAGVPSRAQQRAGQFLQAFNAFDDCVFVSPQGGMGGDSLQVTPAQCERFALRDVPSTDAEDTREAVRHCVRQGCELIVFVGGDGTARDVCAVLGDSVPVLGVPAGVKMHSAVFAITPTAAANLLADILVGQVVSVGLREVRDIDEEAFQQGVVKSRYFGSMRVPEDLRYLQNVKQGGIEVDELVLLDIAAEIEERMQAFAASQPLFVLGSGATLMAIKQQCFGAGTLLGIDVADSQGLVATDVSATRLETLLRAHSGPVYLVVTAIGGQGHVIGRGNQQLSPSVLRRIGRNHVWIVASKAKLKSLHGAPLLIDSNDPELDLEWRGLVPVISGYRDEVLYRIF